MRRFLQVMSWLALAGTIVPRIESNLGFRVAGKIVGVLFPGYFRWGLACGAVALACLLLQRGRHFAVALALLVLMLAATTFQALVIEPKAAALKEQIGSFETTSREDPLRQEFARLHAVSAACMPLHIARWIPLSGWIRPRKTR